MQLAEKVQNLEVDIKKAERELEKQLSERARTA